MPEKDSEYRLDKQNNQQGTVEENKWRASLRTTTEKHLEKKICRRKCEQPVSGSAGGRWRRQHKTELAGDERSVIHWE